MPQTRGLNGELHQLADNGFRNAGNYDAYRPSYPADAVEELLTHLDLNGERGDGAKIVDLAAGTGKLTELLAARKENYELLAIEPHKEMRETLAEKKLDGVVVKEGISTSIPVANAWADGLVIAQAFHWFANEESLREIHRVLKPGASLGMIWNVEYYNSPLPWPSPSAWEISLNALCHTLSQADHAFRYLSWKHVFEAPSPNPVEKLFKLPLDEDKIEWKVWLSPEALWKRYSTLSVVAITEGAERERIKRVFDEAVATADAGKGEKNEKGEIAVNGVTMVYWVRKI